MIYNLKYKNDSGDTIEFSMESGIVIGSATGFTENIVNLSLSQGINQIGSTVQGQAVQAKDIAVTGTIVGETYAGRRLLLRAVKPLVGAKLIYNDEWEIKVYPTQTPAIEKNPTNARFQFIVKAPFPYWNKIESSQTLLSQIEPVFQFPWDLSVPYFQFGGRKEGMFGNVYNEGDVDAPYRVVFTALDELSNPSLTNVVTHEYLRIKKDMSVGETITIDISSFGISVTSNVSGVENDIFGTFDIESNLYRIHPGDNVIKYDAEPNRSGLDVAILYHALKVGAYD